MENGYFIGNIPNIFRQTHMDFLLRKSKASSDDLPAAIGCPTRVGYVRGVWRKSRDERFVKGVGSSGDFLQFMVRPTSKVYNFNGILYYIISYHIILYYITSIILYYIISYYIILYYFYYIILYYIILYYITSIILYYIISYYIILYYIILHHIILYYIIICIYI